MKMARKTDQNFKFVVTILFIVGACLCAGFCSRGHAFSSKPPVTPAPTPSPAVSPDPVDEYAGREMLLEIPAKDLCKDFSYGEKGRAPQSYLKGLTLTYAKVICDQDGDVFKIGSQPLGEAGKDALAHYGLKPATPYERLNMTFGLFIGSNARESDWRPCVGRDTVAKASDIQACLYGGGETCEAGLDQKSYNAIAKSGPSRDLFNEFLSYPKGCFKTEYYGKTTCSAANWKNHGSNKDAVAFQALQKNCPGYTVESGIIGLRTIRTHWGPINKKKAEVVPACVAMFERVRQLILKHPGICNSL